MYHFLLGMTEPIDNPPEPAFFIGNPEYKEENGHKYPNLEYNPEFKGTITFGGDLIQSHDSSVKYDLGAIPLCLAMKDCMEKANGKKPNTIIYIAGNHEMEALNEGQHPEVREIVQGMFKDGLVKYCHYDVDSDTFISHTKLNKPMVEIILNKLSEAEQEEYSDLFVKNENDNSLKKNQGKYELSEIDNPEKRKLLAKLLNENFAKHFEIADNTLFAPNPDGINDFAIVGEELERTYFRNGFADLVEDKQFLMHIMTLSFALKESKGIVSIGSKQNSFEVSNFNDLKNNLQDAEPPLKISSNNKEILLSWEGKFTEETVIKMKVNGYDISSGCFKINTLSEVFAQAINSNQNSRPYSLMNRGALCNFSGGLHGYNDEKDHPEEALDLGCNHVVGHRPTLADPEKGNFTSINEPIIAKTNGETTLQSDYNGKNEETYINCRITKFDENRKPHLVGISRMLDEHEELFEKNVDNVVNDLNRLCDDIYNNETKDPESEEFKQNRNKFIKYFLSNPLEENLDNTKLKEYFEKVGKAYGLNLKNEDSNFTKIFTVFTSITEYQKAFIANKTKIINKQNGIEGMVGIAKQNQIE